MPAPSHETHQGRVNAYKKCPICRNFIAYAPKKCRRKSGAPPQSVTASVDGKEVGRVRLQPNEQAKLRVPLHRDPALRLEALA